MEDDPSSSAESVLPWLWVIEYLACFQQVKASLLHAVLEVAPELPDYLGKDMREVVSLRCLEELCGPRIETADKGSLEDTGSKLDSSKSCEEVLASVIRDDSVSDLKEAEKELFKWDIGSFLEHKRASIPLTALQRLKMKINGATHSRASPLRNIAGLTSHNTGGEAPNVSGECNEPGLDPDGENSGDHEEGVRANLIPTSTEQRDILMEGYGDVRISPRAKRSRTDPAMENLEESLDDLQHSHGCSPDDHSKAKKLKQGQPSDFEDSGQTIVPDSLDSPPKESTNLVEDHVRTLEEDQILRGETENFTQQSADSPDGYKNRADTDDLPGKIDDTSIEKEKINESESLLNKEMESNQTECLPTRHDAEKMSSNTDLHIDVAELEKKKLEFLSCISEENVCMKCGEGGYLMVCHSSTCPLVVHENCVGLSATFDADGKFYCPFCSCSTAIMEYLDSVKEASTAWQELVAFFNDSLIHQPDRLYLVLEQHQSVHGRDEIVHECEDVFPERRREARDHLVQDNNRNSRGTVGDREKNEPSPHISSKKNKKDCSSTKGSEEKENGDAGKTDNENPELELRSPEVDVVINQQDTPVDNLADHVGDAPCPTVNAKGISDNANKGSYFFRGRGSKDICISPIQWRTRQKKAEWTAEEEMILKEGVEKYSDKNGISWTNILAFGGDVLKGRTSMDLKNRWNNMRRKAGK